MTIQLVVNEIFGPTMQGEGKNLGMPCFFLRLGGCNQHCIWCDTPYTWDWTGRNGTKYDPKLELHPMEPEAVLAHLIERGDATGIHNLVVSGGEPMLQWHALKLVTTALRASGWYVEMETAGSIEPPTAELVDQFTVSVKLSNSGNSAKVRINPEAIRFFAKSGRSVFKFVVTAPEDFEEIDALVKEYGLRPVYIMPEGITAENVQAHARSVTAAALERGYHLTTRLQILTYGNQRGT